MRVCVFPHRILVVFIGSLVICVHVIKLVT